MLVILCSYVSAFYMLTLLPYLLLKSSCIFYNKIVSRDPSTSTWQSRDCFLSQETKLLQGQLGRVGHDITTARLRGKYCSFAISAHAQSQSALGYYINNYTVGISILI